MHDEPTRSDLSPPPTPAETAEDTWIGRAIDGRYRIVERLGEGGMGAVFIAEHVQLQKRVALKVIHAHFAGNDEIAARFAREAMTSAHIEHPNVASALDFGSLPEGGAYLVMQLVRGPSLSEHLAMRGALSAAETCQIATQIADAVTAAHAAGVVHRDLKPDNVVLMPNEAGQPTVKVLDFGIAHVKSNDATPLQQGKALTRVGVVIGTPGYMPPEQAMGQGVDERADLYALGVILWELLMGATPFGGETFSEIVTQQLQAPAPELKLRADREIPDDLRLLVRSLLERAPADRPASAAEVRDRLRTISSTLSGSVGGSVSVRAEGDAVSTVRTVPGIPFDVKGEWRWAAAAILLLLVIAAFKFGAKDDPKPVAPAQAVDARPRVTEQAAAQADSRPERTQPAARVEIGTSERGTEAATPENESDTKRGRRGKKGKTTAKGERARPVQRLKQAIGDLLN